MVLCPSCGAQVEGKFCARCGTAVTQPGVGGGAAYSAGPAGATPPYAAGGAPVATSGLTDNVAGLLCYFPLIGLFASIIFLVVEPYNRNRFIRFHAFQSLFLIGALFAFHIAWTIITGIVVTIIHSLVLLLIPISMLIFVAEVALFCWLMFKAYSNERWMLPVIGPLAEKQANG